MKGHRLMVALILTGILLPACHPARRILDPSESGLTQNDQQKFIRLSESALGDISELKKLRLGPREFEASAFLGSKLADGYASSRGLLYGKPVAVEQQKKLVFVSYISRKYIGVVYTFVFKSNGELIGVFSSLEG